VAIDAVYYDGIAGPTADVRNVASAEKIQYLAITIKYRPIVAMGFIRRVIGLQCCYG